MPADPTPPCSICAQLSDYHRGYQVRGSEKYDTFLPAAAASLKTVKELKPGDERRLDIQRCPECGTFYLFKTNFEFLIGGSDEEQHLQRLTNDEAIRYAAHPKTLDFWPNFFVEE